MVLSEEDKQNFLKLVCPGYRSIAEDLINEKINALYIWLEYVGYKAYDYNGDDIKTYGALGQAYIEIFENSTDEPSKVIVLNANKYHMSLDDLHIIRQVVNFYGGSLEYNVLAKSDRDAKLRWELLKLYADDPEACSVIMKRKFKKIYDGLSDSDKLLLEIDCHENDWHAKEFRLI